MLRGSGVCSRDEVTFGTGVALWRPSVVRAGSDPPPIFFTNNTFSLHHLPCHFDHFDHSLEVETRFMRGG